MFEEKWVVNGAFSFVNGRPLEIITTFPFRNSDFFSKMSLQKHQIDAIYSLLDIFIFLANSPFHEKKTSKFIISKIIKVNIDFSVFYSHP